MRVDMIVVLDVDTEIPAAVALDIRQEVARVVRGCTPVRELRIDGPKPVLRPLAKARPR